MKVIHFSNMDNGGAGIAAVRYHNLMKEMGIDSKLYVKFKTSLDDESIIKLNFTASTSTKKSFNQKIKAYLKKSFEKVIEPTDKPKEMYCFYDFKGCDENGLCPTLLDQIDTKDVNFVFVHWLGDCLNSYDLKKIYDVTHAKFIFSMMDLEPITGGCHYPWTCSKFETSCLDCPALSNVNNLLAHNQLMTKAANYSYLSADIFSSALYDLEFARNSIIKFNNYHQLYYPIDENIFKPLEELEKKNEIVLFANVNSVEDPRKGFNYLLCVLLRIDKKINKKIRFLCLSNKKYQGYNFRNIVFEEFEFCKNVNDLVNLYNRTDLFLCASIEDSAPMMVQEALLCGVPVISFDTGVANQFIEDGKQGYVIPRYDIDQFENRILSFIDNKTIFDSSDSIHNHMVGICGKKTIKQKLKNILNA